jgi:hypothetical protein
VLKNSLLPRLLKKVQMQGGEPGTHPEDGCRQMGLFQQPDKERVRMAEKVLIFGKDT